MQAIAQRSRAYVAEPHKLRPDFTRQVCCLEESVRGQCRWGTSAERSSEDRDDLHPEAELRGPTFTQALLRFLSFRIRDSHLDRVKTRGGSSFAAATKHGAQL